MLPNVRMRMQHLNRHWVDLQELLGLASFMTGSSMQEVMTHFKEAFQRFSPQERDPSKSGIRYATRAMLFLAQYASLHGQWSEAHQALMRAHLQACSQLLPNVALSDIALSTLAVNRKPDSGTSSLHRKHPARE